MDGYVTIGTEIDTSGLEKGINEIEKKASEATGGLSDKLQELYNKYKELAGDGIHLESDIKEAEELKKQMTGIVNEIEKLTGEKIIIPGVTDGEAKNNIEDIGKSIKDVTKKVIKWGLAIFGIRSAYNLIRSSMSTILAQDAQLSADVEYMRNVIAYTLEPVIRRIIDLMKTLLSYVGYIIKAWTGKDIFANANKNLGKANKSAKQLQKTLSGFDEINIIGQQDTGGGGGAGATPNMPTIEDQDAPTWLKWIAENGETVLDILFGLGGALIGVKLGLTGIQALGVGVAIFGILTTIQAIIKFLKDPTFENFIKILEGIAIAAIGVGVAIGAWPVAIAGAVLLAIALVLKYYDKIIGFFDSIENWLDTVFYEALKKLFGDKIATAIITPIKSALAFAKGLFEGFWGGIKTVVNGIVKLFKGDFKNGIKDVFKGLKDIMLAPLNALISGLNALIKGINKIKFDVPDWIPLIGGKKFGFNIPQIPKLAKGGIINLPGQGVPLGSAIGGERAKEGVLPLTDQQVMQQLGEAIGKYITINANITNTMNGRIISRELQRVQNDNDFAFNR